MNQINSDTESFEDGTQVLDEGIKNSQLIINSSHMDEDESDVFANMNSIQRGQTQTYRNNQMPRSSAPPGLGNLSNI